MRVKVPVPTPNEDELLVKIYAAGGEYWSCLAAFCVNSELSLRPVCHSDYALKEMEALPAEFEDWKPKFTMVSSGPAHAL